jgi:acyl carrier protein
VAYVTTTAAVVAAEESISTAELVSELRQHLAAQLPDYMVPSAIVRLAALPLTANGKLDRKALPAPDGEAVVQRAYEAPEGELEEQLAALWSELLGVAQVGRRDNFFELGGHSLLAVRLMSRIQSELEISVALSALFTSPDLAAFTKAVLIASLAEFDPDELRALIERGIS